MIQPHELIIGAILEYNIGTINNPEYEPTTIDSYDIGHCELNNADFNLMHRSIPLTEKILLEWCGTFSVKPNQYRIGDRLIVIRDGKFVDYGSSVKLPYLHIFQRFILAITNQPLKIELK
jgi:hypothetical protein